MGSMKSGLSSLLELAFIGVDELDAKTGQVPVFSHPVHSQGAYFPSLDWHSF